MFELQLKLTKGVTHFETTHRSVMSTGTKTYFYYFLCTYLGSNFLSF